MVVISGLHVVVGTSDVVGVVIDGGVWLLDSIAWSQQTGIERGKRGSKATVSTHPKYSQARIYTTYASVSMKWAISVDWTAECQKGRGKPSLSKTSIFKRLAASEEIRVA